MDSALRLKVIFIFVNLAVPFVFGLFPIYFAACKKRTLVGSIGNCFAAGIFLLIGCVHLLAEANESMEEALGDHSHNSYVIALGAYFSILFVEHIAFGGGHNHHHHESPDSSINAKDEPLKKDHENKAKPELIVQSVNGSARNNEDKSIQPLVVNAETPQNLECENINCPPKTSQVKRPKFEDYVPAFVLTTALYIHSIFEGIAMGLLSESHETLILGIAILLHHTPAAVAHSLKMQGLNKYIRLIFLFIFCSASSTGVAIGISLSELDSLMLKAIFLAISSGTFLYIGATEIIPEEFADNKWRVYKFLSLVLGFLPLGIFSIYVES